MSKNVAVFVDVANIFYAAKAAGADIDYVTLLKAAVAGRDFVRAYAYTGLDPENENQRNFHSFLARHGYKVVSKDIRKYGDGKVKANLDIELVVDMMKTARNLDVAIVVSGDGDFAPAIRAVQEMGVRVEVISFRGNTSSDLIEVADAFYDITQVAKVDRDSSRSGRRVAGDDEDLSMTEVPDKQTEGRGGRRGRGRGRWGRGESLDEVAVAPVEARSGRTAGRELAERVAPRTAGGGWSRCPARSCRGPALARKASRVARSSRVRPSEKSRQPVLPVLPRAWPPKSAASPPDGGAAGAAAGVADMATSRRPRAKPWTSSPAKGLRRKENPRLRLPRPGRTSSDRCGIRRSAWPADRSGWRRSRRMRTILPSRRSPNTCWPKSGTAAAARSAVGAAAEASGARMRRPSSGNASAGRRPGSRSRHVSPSPRPSRSAVATSDRRASHSRSNVVAEERPAVPAGIRPSPGPRFRRSSRNSFERSCRPN